MRVISGAISKRVSFLPVAVSSRRPDDRCESNND